MANVLNRLLQEEGKDRRVHVCGSGVDPGCQPRVSTQNVNGNSLTSETMIVMIAASMLTLGRDVRSLLGFCPETFIKLRGGIDMRSFPVLRRLALAALMLFLLGGLEADVAKADCAQYCYVARDRCYDQCWMACLPAGFLAAFYFNCVNGCRAGCYIGWLQCCTNSAGSGGGQVPIQPD